MLLPPPLLQDSPFPRYSEVKAEHVVPGIRSLLAELHAELALHDAALRLAQRAPGGVVVADRPERVVQRLALQGGRAGRRGGEGVAATGETGVIARSGVSEQAMQGEEAVV